jgi:hypothetical protein
MDFRSFPGYKDADWEAKVTSYSAFVGQALASCPNAISFVPSVLLRTK